MNNPTNDAIAPLASEVKKRLQRALTSICVEAGRLHEVDNEC